MEKNKYKIAFNYSSLSFEIESTDLEWLMQKEVDFFQRIELLKSEGAHNIILAKKEPVVVSTIDTSKMELMSTTEFYQTYIKRNGITARNEIALFFVYYLEKIQKKTDIKTGDVTNCFKEIGYPSYSQINFTDVLHQSRRKGLLNNVNSYWTLTMTAMDHILNVITSPSNE